MFLAKVRGDDIVVVDMFVDVNVDDDDDVVVVITIIVILVVWLLDCSWRCGPVS